MERKKLDHQIEYKKAYHTQLPLQRSLNLNGNISGGKRTTADQTMLLLELEINPRPVQPDMHPIQDIRQVFQFKATGIRLHLFEWCDLAITPPFIKHCCQSMLTAQWTHKLPIIQKAAPAELAAELIKEFLDEFPDIDTERYFVIDFCSGAGGPTPVIEKSINRSRTLLNQPAIPFRLSDIHPNIDAWMYHASHSANLSFIPQPVDATDPRHAPPLVISKTSSFAKQHSAVSKTIHLYNLSFHHFSDVDARKVMKSTLATTDGFAIIELQDRTLGMLLLMMLEFALLFLLTICWFPHDVLHMTFTYVFPILPFVQAWDGIVSCLRTRTFEEILALAESELGEEAGVLDVGGWMDGRVGVGEQRTVAVVGEWVFEGTRRLHTWPFGYMNAVVGRKGD